MDNDSQEEYQDSNEEGKEEDQNEGQKEPKYNPVARFVFVWTYLYLTSPLNPTKHLDSNSILHLLDVI